MRCYFVLVFSGKYGCEWRTSKLWKVGKTLRAFGAGNVGPSEAAVWTQCAYSILFRTRFAMRYIPDAITRAILKPWKCLCSEKHAHFHHDTMKLASTNDAIYFPPKMSAQSMYHAPNAAQMIRRDQCVCDSASLAQRQYFDFTLRHRWPPVAIRCEPNK